MTVTVASGKPKILSAMAKVHEGVGNIEKNGVGPQSKGSFAYVKADDIIQKVHELLVENKIVLQPRLEINREVDRSGSRTAISVVVTGTMTFIHAEDGSEFTVSSVGEGSDIGSDTATRKAVTQWQKILLLQTFSIPTGEIDEEGYVDVDSARAPKQSPAQTKVTAAKKPEDELGALRRKVQVVAGKAGLESGAINQIAADHGLSNAYNDVNEIKALIAALEAVAE